MDKRLERICRIPDYKHLKEKLLKTYKFDFSCPWFVSDKGQPDSSDVPEHNSDLLRDYLEASGVRTDVLDRNFVVCVPACKLRVSILHDTDWHVVKFHKTIGMTPFVKSTKEPFKNEKGNYLFAENCRTWHQLMNNVVVFVPSDVFTYDTSKWTFSFIER